jgi:hypothetical protein
MLRTYGNLIQRHREVTAQTLQLNHRTRTCKGPCKRSKSVGQFEGEELVCIRCRKRYGGEK